MTVDESQKIASCISVFLGDLFDDRSDSADIANAARWAFANIVKENKRIREYLQIEYRDDIDKRDAFVRFLDI